MGEGNLSVVCKTIDLRQVSPRCVSSLQALLSELVKLLQPLTKGVEYNKYLGEHLSKVFPDHRDALIENRNQPESIKSGSKLTNLISKFTTRQIYEFREAFNLMDQNRDGFIDLEDLEDVYSCLGEMPTEREMTRMLNEARGDLNFTAYLRMMGQNLSGYDSTKTIQEAFRMFDPDNKGYIPEKYLLELLQTMGDNLSPDEIQKTWEQLPVKDGKVEYKSFVTILTGGDGAM